MPVFILLFFAPVYVPLALLDGWLHAVAKVKPVTPLLEEGRGLISGSPDKTLLALRSLLPCSPSSPSGQSRPSGVRKLRAEPVSDA
jgi:hypothetical protein